MWSSFVLLELGFPALWVKWNIRLAKSGEMSVVKVSMGPFPT